MEHLQRLMNKLEEYDSSAEDVLYEILKKVEGTPVHGMLKAIMKKIRIAFAKRAMRSIAAMASKRFRRLVYMT